MTTTTGVSTGPQTDAQIRILLTGTFVTILAQMSLSPAIAQAAIADVTTAADVTVDSAARVKGMARLGATQGVGQVIGSAVGGLLAIFGLMVPLVAVPVLLVLAVVLVRIRLQPQAPTELRKRPRTVKPTDRRVLPFLLCCAGMYLTLGVIQVIVGFLVQDRLDVTDDRAGLLTGLALLVAGAGVVVSQAVIMPRSRWGPGTLLRVGASTAAVGFLLMVPAVPSAPLTEVLLYVAVGVVAPGTGTATPRLHRRCQPPGHPGQTGWRRRPRHPGHGSDDGARPHHRHPPLRARRVRPRDRRGRRHRAGGRGGIRQFATAGGVLPGGAGNYSGSLRSGLSSSSTFTSL